jgi:cytidylate kinase
MKKLFQLVNKNFFGLRPEKLLAKKHRPVITISREKGSGGRLIAYLVVKKLGKPWKVFHKEIIDEIAKQAHLEKDLIREVDEKKIPVVEEIIDDVFGKRYISLNKYYKHLVKILSTIGQRGHAIVIGRGANFLYPNALKIRIICDMEERIAWIMKDYKIKRVEAIEIIEESDETRSDFVKALFHHDQKKAHHYDLVIRTSKKLTLEDAADIIVKTAKRRFNL